MDAVTGQDREYVRVERDGGIAVVTIDYQERRNAYAMGVKLGLLARVTELMQDKTCRAIVLTGAGGHFCAGGDISQMKQLDLLEMRANLEFSQKLVRVMVNGPKPMVAAVEGYAYGAGMSLATACDYVVASASAKFCCAFVRIGLAPDVGLRYTLSQRVGPAKAKALAMLATEVPAEEAVRIGIADQLCEAGKAREAAIEVALRYASHPPIALGLIKASFARGNDSLDDCLKSELDYQPVLKLTSDHKEAAQAFLQKRKPVFTGT